MGEAVISAILLLCGIAGWFFFFDDRSFLILGPWPAEALGIFVLIVVALVCVPLTRKLILRAFGAVRFTSALAAGGISAIYLLATAYHEQRWLQPYLRDEFSYLIQAHQLARGRLWMPEHPLADFFDSFQLIGHPVYASMYFPGTAMLYAPGVLLHVQPWITSLVIAGIVAGLMHRVVAELVNPLAGWIAVLLLLSCPMFRTLSTMTMSQLPLLLWGLMAMWAYLKWRSSGQLRWMVILGVSLGWAAITRPVDCLCFAIPIGLGLVSNARNRREVLALLIACISTTPFLGIQLIANRGITGRWFETPFRLYVEADYPGTAFGFHSFDPAARPQSSLIQKQRGYVEETQPLIQSHQTAYLYDLLYHRTRLALCLAAATPFPLLSIVLPIALMGLKRDRWILPATLPLFLGFYVFYAYFFPHYVVVVAPGIIVGILIAAERLGMLHRGVGAGFILLIIGTAIAALPQWDSGIRDEMFDAPLIRTVDAQLTTIDKPAVVLFRYSPSRNVDEEPVYNSDAATPDEARIVRAHDLGTGNPQIYRYYSQRQPDRVFYLFDEGTETLTRLGAARELAGMSR